MAFPDQPAGRIVRTGIVVEVEPRVRLREMAAPERQERKTGGLQLLKTGIAIQRVCHDQRIYAAALHHPHVAVFVRQIVIGNQQQIDFMSRQFVANFADHVHKYAVIERNRMDREHQPNGVDFAHLQTTGEGIRSVTTALGLCFHACARLGGDVVISVEGAADGGDRQPQFFGNGFKRHEFPYLC